VYTDLSTGTRARKIRGHRGIINALDRTIAGGAGTELLASASDDGTVKVWEGGDEGSKEAVATLEIGCPATSVAWSADGAQVFVGALDNEIHVRPAMTWFSATLRSDTTVGEQVFDIRTHKEVYSLTGHTDTPTSLALSPNGHFLLSPSFSSQTIVHDVRPFSAAPNRVHRVLAGAPAGFEHTLLRGAWSLEDGGRRVAVGGADRTVCIWEMESGRVLYKLPGHKGTVTAVDFHPKEPISEFMRFPCFPVNLDAHTVCSLDR
jgi:Prp8 binding protein